MRSRFVPLLAVVGAIVLLGFLYLFERGSTDEQLHAVPVEVDSPSRPG